MDINKRRGGFTLAEVLITLSIIGVVAALTIPSLVVKNQEKQTVVQLKKAYNVFSNALALAQTEYGEISGWGWQDSENLESNINILNKIAPHLNLIKRCDGTKGCFPSGVMYQKYMGGTTEIYDDINTVTKGILADGTLFRVGSWGSNCTSDFGSGKSETLKNLCGGIDVDINGMKGPNKWGVDMFNFFISARGLVPAGTPDSTSVTVAQNCRGQGNACTAWVLLKENLDYPPLGTGWGD